MQVSKPRTEAGRAWHDKQHATGRGLFHRKVGEPCPMVDAILAIEREAAAPQPLDVEAMGALLNTAGSSMHYGLTGMNAHPDPNTSWRDCLRPLCRAAFDLSAPYRRTALDPVLARLSRKEPSDE